MYYKGGWGQLSGNVRTGVNTIMKFVGELRLELLTTQVTRTGAVIVIIKVH